MNLFRTLRNAVAKPPRRSGPPPLTGFQLGLLRAADRGRLLLDAWYLGAYLAQEHDLVEVSTDVGVLMRARLLGHDPVDLDVPPELRPRWVHYHPTARGEDVLMAANQRKNGGRRA